jgi:hypothetical protein
MLLSPHQNAGQNHDIKRVSRCFENVAQFRYLGKTETNQNLIREEIKRRLNSGNAYYHSIQNRIYKTIILPGVLDGCETWSLILRNKHRLRVFENRVLRRIFGSKRDEVMGG